MAYFSKNTVETLKEMMAFYREHGSARVDCTKSFAAGARSALSALRKGDVGWYTVRLSEELMPEGEEYEDERGNLMCVFLTMEKAEGKTTGARAKRLREAGMLVEKSGQSSIAMPMARERDLEREMANSAPIVLPWQMVIGCEILGGDVYDTVEAIALTAPLEYQSGYKDRLFAELTEAEKNDANFRENVLVKKWVDYWRGREEELFTGASVDARRFMRFDLLQKTKVE